MDPYERLANAVIIRAAQDYRSARKRLRRHLKNEPVKLSDKDERWIKWDVKKKDMLIEISEIERFFKSEWFMVLSDADGPALFEKLRKEADSDER